MVLSKLRTYDESTGSLNVVVQFDDSFGLPMDAGLRSVLNDCVSESTWVIDYERKQYNGYDYDPLTVYNICCFIDGEDIEDLSCAGRAVSDNISLILRLQQFVLRNCSQHNNNKI